MQMQKKLCFSERKWLGILPTLYGLKGETAVSLVNFLITLYFPFHPPPLAFNIQLVRNATHAQIWQSYP